jgi:hypothetical protein
VNELNKKWIVFWKNGGRIGSIELTDSNWAKVKEAFRFSIIQTDVSGTIHLNIFGLIIA